MDPAQVLDAASAALGESSSTAEAVLRDLLSAFPEGAPDDWPTVEQAASSHTGVELDKVAALLDALKALASAAGSAEDPRTILDDHEVRGYFASPARNTDAEETVPAPVAGGSSIRRVGEEYYLGEGHQVWQATSGDFVYYYDAERNYDAFGSPLDAPESAGATTGQSDDHDVWNRYLAENGLLWDGTEPSWRQFRDWFLYDAAAHGVGESARGFIALAESAADKLTVFADYGIALVTGAGLIPHTATGTTHATASAHADLKHRAAASAAPAGTIRIQIQEGQTLSGLAHHYGTTVAHLQQINGLGTSTLIRADAYLLVPAARGAAAPTSGASAHASPAAGGHSSNAPGTSTRRTRGANVTEWIEEAFAILESAGVPASELDARSVATIIEHESSGNPHAVNTTDRNFEKGDPSRGLMQTISATFEQYKLPGHDDILDPVDNIIAGVRYALHRYGSTSNVPGIKALAAGKKYVGY